MHRLSLLVLLVSTCAAAQSALPRWDLLENAPSARARFDDVTFIDANRGWLVSTDGEIWHTGDGGTSWNRQRVTPIDRFRSVAFADERVGFVGTVFGSGEAPPVLYETRDGGQTWTDATWRIVGPRPAGICGMWAVDELNIYGVGAFHGSPTLIRTLNGGDTWYSTSLSRLAGTLVDVLFVTPLVGFATGGSGERLDGNAVVLRTRDGGTSWEKVYETERDTVLHGEWGWKISFPTEQVGYVSVEYSSGQAALPAKVLKTVDGGDTWAEIRIEGSTDSAGLQAVGFVSENVGWVGGRGTTSVTSDGGETWAQLPPWSETTPNGQLDGSVNRIFTVSDTLAYAIGKHVYRLDSADSGVDTEPGPDVPDGFDVGPAYPNPASGPVTLPLRLDRATRVRFWIIDLLGRPVRDYPASVLGPGTHPLAWDGRDGGGRRVAPGPYLLLLDVGDSTEMKQVIIVE